VSSCPPSPRSCRTRVDDDRRSGRPAIEGPLEYDDEPTRSVQYEVLGMPYTTLALYFSPGDGTPESMGLVQVTFSTT
jgi:hypothetical protein